MRRASYYRCADGKWSIRDVLEWAIAYVAAGHAIDHLHGLARNDGVPSARSEPTR
jgi:hypothetical protein